MPSLLSLLTCSNPVGCQTATIRTSALLEKYFSRPCLVINDVTLEGKQQHSCRQIACKRSKTPRALGAAASLLSLCTTQGLSAAMNREKINYQRSADRSQLMDWEVFYQWRMRREGRTGKQRGTVNNSAVKLFHFAAENGPPPASAA